jgi:hypothetical protein
MARGWESKSVQEQQAEAAFPTPGDHLRPLPDQIAKHQRRQGLQLSRRRVQEQLREVDNPRHRQMLEQALAELDARLSTLS